MVNGEWSFDGDNYAIFSLQRADQDIVFIASLNSVMSISQENSLTFFFDDETVGDIEILDVNGDLLATEEDRTFGWFKHMFGLKTNQLL